MIYNCETDGGKKYLEDEATAIQQTNPQYCNALVDKNNNSALKKGALFQFPKAFWANVSANDPVAHLLFEAAGESKGQLTTVLLDNQGKEIGRGPAHYFQLMDVRKMYYRAKALPEEIPAPYGFSPNQPPGPNMTFQMDPENPNDPDPNQNAFVPYHFENYKANAVVFVHGWWMTEEESRNFAETMFKRLWHQGYRDTFVAFRWATMTGPFTFNNSEYRAWKSGKPFKEFVGYFRTNFMAGIFDFQPQVNIVAHSMGNIVVGSALKQGLTINNYVLMQGAIPAGCYDESGGEGQPSTINSYQTLWDEEANKPTPDTEGDFGYRGYLKNVTGNLINFYNPEDYALATGDKFISFDVNWEKNQKTYKPNSLGTVAYEFDPNKPDNQMPTPRHYLYDVIAQLPARPVLDPHESMSFLARSRSKAVGARDSVHGSINAEINLHEDPYNFTKDQKEHSGQFNRTIQKADEFYKTLNEVFKLK